MQWIRCTEQLPNIAPRRRKNKNGILVMFDDGEIVHYREVTRELLRFIELGPRPPLKYEDPMPPRIILWAPLPHDIQQTKPPKD